VAQAGSVADHRRLLEPHTSSGERSRGVTGHGKVHF
jgi:hypothetical protein